HWASGAARETPAGVRRGGSASPGENQESQRSRAQRLAAKRQALCQRAPPREQRTSVAAKWVRKPGTKTWTPRWTRTSTGGNSRPVLIRGETTNTALPWCWCFGGWCFPFGNRMVAHQDHSWWATIVGWCVGGVLLSHTPPGAVPSALGSLASGFGMGPRGPSPLSPPTTLSPHTPTRGWGSLLVVL